MKLLEKVEAEGAGVKKPWYDYFSGTDLQTLQEQVEEIIDRKVDRLTSIKSAIQQDVEQSGGGDDPQYDVYYIAKST